MSNSPRRRPSSTATAPAGNQSRVLLIAGAVVALVVVIGIVIAMSGSDDTDTTAGDAPAFGPVTVEGASLPEFTSTADDPAMGMTVPTIEGTDPAGAPVTIEGTGEPTLVTYLAHYCPHCQAEVPVIVDMTESGQLDGVRVVGVLTGTNEARPNYPPVAWLEREGWAGEILLDDEQYTAAQAVGLSAYPFMLYLDGEGTVVARTSGEIAPEAILALLDEAR